MTSSQINPAKAGGIPSRERGVARYIAEQQGKKDVFEYSIFGNPDVKIGDFTQTKLGGF